ncbi:hypothetical protein E4V01_14660 [Methylorubrum sp. Q1]|nr:hypothetical protein E4V01_14660 [Methylorubrum sp. Q1]
MRCCEIGSESPFPRIRGAGAVQEETLSAASPHPRLPARSADNKVDRALSPPAGRGDVRRRPE